MPSDTLRDSCQSFLEAERWTKLFGHHHGWELAINNPQSALGLGEEPRTSRAGGHVLWLPNPGRSEDGPCSVLFNAGPDDPGSSEVGQKQTLDMRVLFLIAGEQASPES